MPLVSNNKHVSSPKRKNAPLLNRASWYTYYAGYSPQFAKDIIGILNVPKDSIILDPWNGIGTTTLAASAAGCVSKGFDLSPAPVIVAKALNISVGDKPSILPLTKEITSKASRIKGSELDEPLRLWFTIEGSTAIRSLEKAIQSCLVRAEGQKYCFIYFNTDSVSELAAFFYLALFNIVRGLIDKFTGSNPTWVKKAKSESEKVGCTFLDLKHRFEEEISRMLDSFNQVFTDSLLSAVELKVGNSTQITCDSGSIDFVISSPPYCTRIDYAVYMMPELALLGFSNNKFDSLRRNLIGTTTVPSVQSTILEDWGQKCNIFLNRLKVHTSVSSADYYLKNHVQYFDLMFKSISEISRILKKEGSCVLVVQDSFYKEIHTDLPGIVSEMSYNAGLGLNNSLDFEARNNMATVNQGSKKYRSASPATESVLFFQKY